MALSTADRVRLLIACGKFRLPPCLKDNSQVNARRLYAYFRRGATPASVTKIARLACECNSCTARGPNPPRPVPPPVLVLPPPKDDPKPPPPPKVEACPLPDADIEPPTEVQ